MSWVGQISVDISVLYVMLMPLCKLPTDFRWSLVVLVDYLLFKPFPIYFNTVSGYLKNKFQLVKQTILYADESKRKFPSFIICLIIKHRLYELT